jgi:SOUL heme-binding protein
MTTFFESCLSFFKTMVFFMLSPLGVNYQTQEPPYHIVKEISPAIQVRHYAPRLVAQVTLSGDADVQRQAFEILAGYIFGANQSARSLAMTAPVEMSAQKISMTSPVSIVPSADNYTMRFFLPDDVTFDNAPQPRDPRVHIISLDARDEIVLQFSGRDNQRIIQEKMNDLNEIVHTLGLKTDGAPIVYLYNPPWTLPFLRRNEISIRLAS